MKLLKVIVIFLSVVILNHYSNSQPVQINAEKIDSKTRAQTVNKIAALLADNYVFPEVGINMGELIKQKLQSGEYDNIDDPMQFSSTLTQDLQSVSRDKHVSVVLNPVMAKELTDRPVNFSDTTVPVFEIENMKRNNYGFRKLEILPGNIGYIDLAGFNMMRYTRPTLEAAMKFIENTDAIIFDLRKNGGGDGETVNLLCSYLLPPGVNINNAYFRNPDTTLESWTLENINGKRLPDIPVYLLTSSYTFSAAEEFCFDLKYQNRAVIIGETTGGGANPNNFFAVNDMFVLSSAIGQSINPVSKTNWEGTGVKPDIEVDKSKALELAKIEAYNNLASNTSDIRLKARYEWLAENVKYEMNPVSVDESTLEKYAGNYGDRIVTYTDGKLFYERKGRPKFVLIPVSEDMFRLSDIDYFRVKFVKDANGKVTELTGIYDNGNTDRSVRVN